MKHIQVFIGAFLLLVHFSRAQSFDEFIFRNRYITCMDVTYNAAGIIAALSQAQRYDSLYSFLAYWENKCGKVEPVYRLRLILDIKAGRFNPDQVNREMLGYMMEYRNVVDDQFSLFYRGREPYVDYQQSISNINLEIKRLAQSVSFSGSTDEALIVQFYSSEKADFKAVKNTPVGESNLRRVYDEYKAETERIAEGHLALIVGHYKPYGKIGLFGSHPSIGMVYGFRKMQHAVDLVLDFRIGPSKENYTIYYRGQFITDNTWTGVFAGVEYTYDFIRHKKLRVGLSPGVAYEGITALTTDNDYGEDSKILPSLNINGGLVVKQQLKRNGYLGLHVRYNHVDHKNVGGTELNGNYLNVRFILGNFFNYSRDSRMRLLE